MEKLKSLLKFVKVENVQGWLKKGGIAGVIASVGFLAANVTDVLDVSDPIGLAVAGGVGLVAGNVIDWFKGKQ